jgi:acetoacetyl-CoA synthetase
MKEPQPIFVPSREDVAQTQLTDFIRYCETQTGQDFSRYADFETFTIARYRMFWKLFLEWLGLPFEGDSSLVCADDLCESAEFFPNIRLNYAECLLHIRDEADAARPALWSCRPDQNAEYLTRGELKRRVAALAAALEERGIGPGSRVAIIAHNDSQAVIAMLAAAALGAVVSLTSTELASFATIARFEETQPVLLFCHLRSPFPAVEAQLRERVADVIAALPCLQRVIALDEAPVLPGLSIPFDTLDGLIARAPASTKPWARFAFNHPLFALFTSGTSGRPKCLIQGAGGILIENLKEMRLHIDVRPSDKVFFQTSTAWVIWQLLVSALAARAEVVLNSRPVSSPRTLWDIVGEEAVTVFGTSPAYLQLGEANGFVPRDHIALEPLRTLLSTGSVLYKAQQDWVMANVKPIPVRSMYGATDIAGAFVTCNPNLPVHAGECQARSLGLDIRALHQGEMGLAAPIGEVVCANPFPSRPLGFLNDADGSRFHDAYFARNPGFWTQGDLIAFTPNGGARLYGRSDGILNIRGVRIGPVEIYEAIKSVPEVTGALAVAQAWPEAPGGERLVLLVTLAENISLADVLSRRIKSEIRQKASPVHVPDTIAHVAELPATHNGKLSERSAADAINGRTVVNLGALRNPECLERIASHPALSRPKEQSAEPVSIPIDEPTEGVVTRVFERIFARGKLQGSDNFFDLGGDSLTAIKILLALDDVLGTSLPMTILYKAPTIAGLAQAIDRRGSLSDHSLLVTLKDGSGPPPLFVIPGLDGAVMKHRSLALAINYPGAIMAIQAQGVNGEAEPLTRVEDMAGLYVEAIRTTQPHGPYLFIGHSLGGLIAMEMAQILRAAGEDVFPLILLDTPIDEKYWPAKTWIATLIRRIGIHTAAVTKGSTKERWNYVVHRVFGFFQHFVHRYDTDTDRRFAGYDIELPEALIPVYKSSIVAAANYRPRFFDHAVVLFDPDNGFYRGCDTAALWSRFVADITVHTVEGDHLSILYPPHNEALAAAISDCLASMTLRESVVTQPNLQPALAG